MPTRLRLHVLHVDVLSHEPKICGGGNGVVASQQERFQKRTWIRLPTSTMKHPIDLMTGPYHHSTASQRHKRHYIGTDTGRVSTGDLAMM
eukprot:6468244-Amphidinium_carterae.1